MDWKRLILVSLMFLCFLFSCQQSPPSPDSRTIPEIELIIENLIYRKDYPPYYVPVKQDSNAIIQFAKPDSIYFFQFNAIIKNNLKDSFTFASEYPSPEGYYIVEPSDSFKICPRFNVYDGGFYNIEVNLAPNESHNLQLEVEAKFPNIKEDRFKIGHILCDFTENIFERKPIDTIWSNPITFKHN